MYERKNKMNKSDKTAASCFIGIGAAALIPLLIIVTYLINGFVLSKMWLWFIVTTFGAPVLTVPQAIGVGMIVSFLTYRATPKNKDSNSEWSQIIIDILSAMIAPFVTLLIAWIVYSGWIVQ